MAFTQEDAIAYYNRTFVRARSVARVAAMLYCYAHGHAIAVGGETYRDEGLSALLLGDEQGAFLETRDTTTFRAGSAQPRLFSVERYDSEEVRTDLGTVVRYAARWDGRMRALLMDYAVAEEVLLTRSPEEFAAYLRSDRSVLGL
jgi:hypothetical protein